MNGRYYISNSNKQVKSHWGILVRCCDSRARLRLSSTLNKGDCKWVLRYAFYILMRLVSNTFPPVTSNLTGVTIAAMSFSRLRIMSSVPAGSFE